MDDVNIIRKNIIYLSKGTGSSMEYFMNLPLFELHEVTQDYLEVLEEYGRK